jgi:putative oxygen-independent coproporphyrinogen III oxidase
VNRITPLQVVPMAPVVPGEPGQGGNVAQAGQAPHDALHYLRAGTLQFSTLPPLALYLHLPWCLKKCPYCDFNSHEWRGTDAERAQRDYVIALLADLDAALPLVWGRAIVSVFIGGGTPSLFAPDVVADLLSGVRARLKLLPGSEVTLEANPGTFEADRFAAFAQAGVSRLSIGVQSFNDAHLHAIGRVHDGAQARAAVQEAARSFATFNLDLMYALPGQTLAQLQADVAQALAFAPPHLSIYHLTMETNTVFGTRPPPGLPDDDAAFDMLDHLVQATEQAGLARYEVSAFSRQGHACVHNRNYWQFGDYLGLGAGAHSKLTFAHRVVRQVRLRDPALYQRQALAGRALAQDHDVKRADLPFEFMLNALRLKEGFTRSDYRERTGLPLSTLEAPVAQGVARGWLTDDGERVMPTPRGFDWLSDLQSLFLPD